ncbi:MAG: lipase [Gemmatimonadaceae bacterium]
MLPVSQIRRLAVVGSLTALAACSPDSITGPGPRSLLLVAPAHHPVLFIHGWNSSGAVWTTTISRFVADGYTPAELATWSYNANQSNAITAQQISVKVDSILNATGAFKVDIVTHSMGSLSARYYLKSLGGSFKVDALVTLGGPDHGTNTAWFCSGTACAEMRPGSSFIKSLNSVDETPGGTRYATWRSPCDEVINPLSSPILSGGATNNQTACMRHSDLHESVAVYNAYKGWLQ